MKKIGLSILTMGLLFTSCASEDDTTRGGNGASTITASEKDQAQSFGAIKQIHDGTKNRDKTGAEIKGIYDTNLREHIAVDVYHTGTKTAIRDEFSGWILSWGDAVASEATAGNGVAGLLENRIVDAKAIEQEQLIKKGMIGAYQLSNAITEAQKAMAPNANKEEILVNLTAYILGSYSYLDKPKEARTEHGQEIMAYPVFPGNEMTKYLGATASNPKFSTIEDDLFNALKDARTNINNNDVFKAKILEAVGIAQKSVAIRAVYYLLNGADIIEDETKFAKAIHGISEGFGFYYSLQFTYNPATHQPYVTKAEADAFFSSVNLWDVSTSKTQCQELAESIAAKFGFSANDAR